MDRQAPTPCEATGRAPIALFAFKRPEHTRRALDALASNAEWRDSPLYVYCDGPRNENERAEVARTLAVVQAYPHPRKEVIASGKNQGLATSIAGGVSELVKIHGRVIVVEDDLVVSSAFLGYMNAALDRYADEPSVLQISGHMFPLDLSRFGEAVFLPFTTTWGWGTWARAWDGELRHPAEAIKYLADHAWRTRFDIEGAFPFARMLADQIRGRNDSWGIWWYFRVFQQQGLVLYPTMTLVNNEGFDGSGTHCADDTGRAEAPLAMRAPSRLPDIANMPEATAAVREYLLRSRGFARRIKDRWMRTFPALPKVART